MKFGLSFLPDAEPSTKSCVDYYRDAVEMAVLADQAGLSTLKMTEHHAGTYGGYCPDPLLFLTAVAQRTRQIRLMTGCILPAFHHPIQLAGRIAQADVLCGGRLDVGFARAFLPNEFDMFGLDMDESRSRFEAVIEAVEGLFTEPKYSAETPFFKFSDVALTPPSIQSPHPPFWGAAARSRESFAWLGAKGFNLLTAFTVQEARHLQEQLAVYREVYATSEQAAGGASGQIAMLVPLFVHQRASEAHRLGEQYLNRYHQVWAKACASWRGRASIAYPGYTNMGRLIEMATPSMMKENGSVVFGDPVEVREHVARLSETFDVDQILWNVDFGAMPREDALGSVRLLLGEVL